MGGRAYTYRRGGFTFDAGPTVVTAPFLFDELYDLFGKKREDYVRFVPLYPWYRIRFDDGSHFDYGGTLDQTLEQIRRIEPADADGYLRLLEKTRRIFDVGFTQLADQPFDTLWSMLRISPQMLKLGVWRTVWQMASKYLRSEKLRRVFSFQPLLVGGNPFTTTSIYSLIHYLERQWGVHFAMGGTGAVVDAMEKLMREQGVEIRLNSSVGEIVVRDAAGKKEKPRAAGVKLSDGQVIEADLVVCNADAPFAYKHMIAPRHRRKWTDQRVEKMNYSAGLFVLYFGTTRQYPEVQHHTILLGRRYREYLDDLFDRKILATEDLSLYLHRPTRTDPSMAPPGCDSFYVLCPVPNLQGPTDWNAVGPRYRECVIAALSSTLLPGLGDCITQDFYVTPNHFRDHLSTLHGTGFSIQPTFTQSAWFRFHNRSEDVAGLYFVGAAAHPGAGVPGVLCSAKVLDHLIPPAQ